MAFIDSAVVDAEYDYDDPSRTLEELVSRLRFCFRESDFVKVVSVLTARENKMKEEIAACERVNQRLKNELEKLDRHKRKAESDAERWKALFTRLESRVSLLEKDAEQVKSKQSAVRVSGENGRNCENVDLEMKVVDVDALDSEERVDSAAAVARNTSLAREGSGRTPTRNILIIDSDDEVAPEGGSGGKASTYIANPHKRSSQNATEMLKRNLDFSSGVSKNDSNDGADVGDTLTGGCNRNKLQKVTHVHDGSPENHGSAADKNIETYFTLSSPFPSTLRQCEKKLGAEHANRNLMSEFLSDGIGEFIYEDSSSSSSSSDSDDGQEDDKKWDYEVDVIASLGKDDELCLKAVCALYRQQTLSGTSPRNMSFSSNRGFNHSDVLRGVTLARFLTDGDQQGRLKKSVSELLQFDQSALHNCRRIAIDHAKQLLEIYKKEEDPLFQP